MALFGRLAKLVLLVAVVLGVAYALLIRPGQNGLGFLSTSEEVIAHSIKAGANLDGYNIIVTGGYGGIGLVTVAQLAKWKTNIWVPARDVPRCEKELAKIKQQTKNQNLFCEHADLSSMASVSNFAKKWREKNLPLNLLINNAGVMATPYTETVDGFELQFATNHLSHFLLTKILFENLKKGAPSRVVSVSSLGHMVGGVNFDDITGNNTWYSRGGATTIWGPAKAYAQTKTANILFSNELNKRMKGFGNANSLHPGSISTGLGKHSMNDWGEWFLQIFGKTVSQGAATTLYVATSPELNNVGGRYFDDSNEAVLYRNYIYNEVDAANLWNLSEEMTLKWH